jgi:hypothetical protein
MEDSYYKRNRVKILERVKVYQSNRKEEYRLKYKEWYEANKDVVNEKRRQKRLANPKPKVPKPPKVKPAPEPPVFVAPPPPESTIEYTGHDFILSFD